MGLVLPFEMRSWFYYGKRPILSDVGLSLRREPKNKYDKCAVAVCKDGRKVGYVPATYSERVSKAIEQGRKFRIRVAIDTDGAKEMDCTPHLVIQEID